MIDTVEKLEEADEYPVGLMLRDVGYIGGPDVIGRCVCGTRFLRYEWFDHWHDLTEDQRAEHYLLYLGTL